MKKWIVLLVILILVVPYKIESKSAHPTQNSNSLTMQGTVYKWFSYRKNTSGKINRELEIPIFSHNFIVLGFYYNNHYEPQFWFVVWNWYNFPSGNSILFEWGRK